MNGAAVLFSTDRNDWETPHDLFAVLDDEFNFTLDVAASKENSKCKVFISAEQDALVSTWGDVNWCNPPYSKTKWFLARAVEMAAFGHTSVLLIPARTDTKMWHGYVSQADEVRFLKGRVKFVGGQASAPFPSAVVVFRPRPHGFYSRGTHYWTWDWRA